MAVFLVALLVCCVAACVLPVLAHPKGHYVSYNGSKTEEGYDVVVIQRFCADCGEPLPLNHPERNSYCDVCAENRFMPMAVILIVGCIVVVCGLVWVMYSFRSS